MYLILIGFVLGILFAIRSSIKERSKKIFDYLIGPIGAGLFGAFIGFIATGVISIGLCIFETETIKGYVDTKSELVAFNDRFSSELNGSFILFFGSISSKEIGNYIFYYQDENGGIRQGKVKTKNAVIYETEKQPYKITRLEYNKQKLPDNRINWFWEKVSFLSRTPNIPEAPSVREEWRNIEHIFYVPKESVITQFQADLE